MIRSLLLALLATAACGKNNDPPPPSSGSPNAKPESGPGRTGGAVKSPAERARALFDTLCVTCHGAEGKGNGPAAAALNPRPRDYTDPAWQASVTDDDLKKIITKGGKAVGKSENMPAQTQLEQDPEELNELVKIIRSFKK